MKPIYLMNDFINPDSMRYWSVTYKDHDAMTCNPCVIVSDRETVLEIERTTVEMRKAGKNVFIYVSKTVRRIEDLLSVEQELKSFQAIGFKHDPWLIW